MMELKDHILKLLENQVLHNQVPEGWVVGKQNWSLTFVQDSISLLFVDVYGEWYPTDHKVWKHAALALNVDWNSVLAQRAYNADYLVDQEIRKRGYRASSTAALRHFILDSKLPEHIVHWNVLNKTEEFLKWLDEAKESCGIDLGGMIAFHSRLK